MKVAVLRKEMRSMLRERRAWLVPMLYATVLSAAAYLFHLPELAREPAELGAALAGLVAVMQAVALCVFAPLVGAAAIAAERERGTWTRLLSSPVGRRSIVTGKLLAAWSYVLVLCVVSLPIAALSWIFGATDLETLAGLYATHAVLGVALTSLGLAVSTLFHRTWTAALVAIALALGLGVFTLAAFAAFGGLGRPFEDASHVVLWWNPGYGMVLFFAGDQPAFPHGEWLGHFAAMSSIAVVSIGFAALRLRRLRD